MGKVWKRAWLRRKLEAAKVVAPEPEKKVIPAPKSKPAPEPVVEEKVVEKPKPKRSYKAKKNSTAKKKVKK